jgi:hypothetical protein
MRPLNPENDVTAYIVVEDFGQWGRHFESLAEADLGTIVRNMISGEYKAGRRLQHRRRVVPGCVRGDRLRCARQGFRCRHDAERGRQAVHQQACNPGREAGAVGATRTRSVGSQEGVRPGSTSHAGWPDGRQDSRARHRGWRRQAEGGLCRTRRGRARRRPLEPAPGHRPRMLWSPTIRAALLAGTPWLQEVLAWISHTTAT